VVVGDREGEGGGELKWRRGEKRRERTRKSVWFCDGGDCVPFMSPAADADAEVAEEAPPAGFARFVGTLAMAIAAAPPPAPPAPTVVACSLLFCCSGTSIYTRG